MVSGISSRRRPAQEVPIIKRIYSGTKESNNPILSGTR